MFDKEEFNLRYQAVYFAFRCDACNKYLAHGEMALFDDNLELGVCNSNCHKKAVALIEADDRKLEYQSRRGS